MNAESSSLVERQAAKRIRRRERLMGAVAVFCRNWRMDEWSSGAPVLLYHRVVDDDGVCDDPFAVREREFDRQVAWLAANKRVVTVADLAERLASGTDAGNYAAISFDDGYDCSYLRALPVLQKHGVKATVFIDTGRVGGDRPALAAGEIVELHSAGIEIASHTVSHVSLWSLSPEIVMRELVDSRSYLEDLTGSQVRGFAYPFGDFGANTSDMVSAAGYSYGCTCLQHRTNRPHDNPFHMARVEINIGDDLARFRKKLVGGYAGVYRAWYRLSPAMRFAVVD